MKEIDGLRFIAIFFVVFSHIRTVFFSETGLDATLPLMHGFANKIITSDNGINGVRIFFGLSGFILAYPFFMQGATFNIKDYFARRVSRLEPTYLISLIIYFFAMVAIKGKILFVSFAFSVIYLHSLVFQKPSEINPITWSLEVEVQYYLFFPVLLYFFQQFNKLSPFLSYGFIFVVICFGIYNQHTAILPYKTLLSEIQYFLTGFLAANIIRNKFLNLKKVNPKLVAFLLCIVVVLLFITRVGDNSIFNQVAFVLLVFVLFMLVLIPASSFRKLLTTNLVYLTGGMCYTIYLYHIASLVLISPPYIGNVLKPDIFSFLLFTVSGLVLIWLSSYILYVLFEKPFMLRKWYTDPVILRNYYQNLFSKKRVINE